MEAAVDDPIERLKASPSFQSLSLPEKADLLMRLRPPKTDLPPVDSQDFITHPRVPPTQNTWESSSSTESFDPKEFAIGAGKIIVPQLIAPGVGGVVAGTAETLGAGPALTGLAGVAGRALGSASAAKLFGLATGDTPEQSNREAVAQGGGSLAGDTMGSVTDWLTGVSAARKVAAARAKQAAEMDTAVANRAALQKSGTAARETAQMEQAAANASHQRALDEATARVSSVFDSARAASPGDAASRGTLIRDVYRSGRNFEMGAAGSSMSAAEAPLVGRTVDVSDLLDQLNMLPQNIPRVAAARAELMDLFPRTPGGAIASTEIPVVLARDFSKKYGGMLQAFNPTYAQAQVGPIRQGAEDVVESALTPSELPAYVSAKAEYKNAADQYKNKGSAIRPQLSPTARLDPAAAALDLTSAKARRNPAIAGAYMRALSAQGPSPALAAVRAQVGDDLMSKGIEGLGNRLAGYNSDVLSTYLGTSDTEALQQIADRLPTLQKVTIPEMPELPALPKQKKIPNAGVPLVDVLPGIIKFALPNKGMMRKVVLGVGQAALGNLGPLNALRMAAGAGAAVVERGTRPEQDQPQQQQEE